MRILLVADDLEIGGVSTVVVSLARELLGRGHQVGVLAGPTGDLWARLPDACERHFSPSRFSIVGYPRTVRRVVMRHEYDVVHAHQRGAALWSRVAVRSLGVPVIEHVHNQFRANALAFLSFRGDRLIACGSAVKRMLVDEFRRPEDRIDLVVNGVPDLDAPPVGRHSLDAAAFHVLGVGRLSEQKDPERFVRVIAELKLLLAPSMLRATWVGDGPLRADVERAIVDLGLEDVIDLVGARDDVPARLASSDLLLLTSRHEGLPLVILEAMRAGRGAVAPDVGSCADAVTDGVTGRLYDPLLADAELASLLAHDLLSGVASGWADSARQRFLERFTVASMTDGVMESYRRAGADRRTHPVT